MKNELILVGFKPEGEDWIASNSKETRQQIEYVKSFECILCDEEGNQLTWLDFDDQNEPRTLFQSIEQDRSMRIDNKTFMANRPSFVAVTIVDGKAVRLEYYAGHDALELVYDIRSKELHGKALEPFMKEDGCAYDPAEFLENVFGIPRDVSKPILKEIHKKE